MLVNNVKVSQTALSDHGLIEVMTNLFSKDEKRNLPDKQIPSIGTFDFNKAEWSKVSEELKGLLTGESINGAENIDQAYEIIVNGVVEACQRAGVPLKKRPRKQNIPRDRKRLFEKRRLLKRKENNPKLSDRHVSEVKRKLCLVEKALADSYVRERREEEEKAIESIKTNSKYFFKYANKKSKVREIIGPLNTDSEGIASEPKDVAETLNLQYKKAFSQPKLESVVDNVEEFFGSESSALNGIEFTIEDVKEAMKSFRQDASPGPDFFPAAVLKNCSESLSEPLFHLFRRSLNSGQICSIFKEAIITPLYKGGDRAKPGNYRPVALTSHVGKCLEKVVRKHLVRFLEENNLMNPSQHGFRGGRSTVSQLIEHIESVIEGLEEGGNVDVVYLDFSKAFDKVDHGVLLHEIRRLGIGGKLGTWLHSFLTGRTQKVSVEKVLSDACKVVSGVPQGTVLGPILFLIMLRTIDEGILYSIVGSFADDSKILKPIQDVEDTNKMQTDLTAVYEWAKDVNMELNGNKFQLLRYGPIQNLKDSTKYKDTSGEDICEEKSAKDLGIVLSSDGRYDLHTSKVVTKSRQMCGWIFRTFQTRELTPMMTLYKTMVLSRLDYCSILWHPTGKALVDEVESIQRLFTRRISGLGSLSYWERLETLKLYSIQRRHERYMIIYMFKILHNLVPGCGITFRENERLGIFANIPVCRSDAPTLAKSMRNSSFGYRGPRLYNLLPAALRRRYDTEERRDIVGAFKRDLDVFLTKVPDQPTIQGLSRAACSNSMIDQVPYRL